MAMNGTDRGDAVYSAMASANPNFSKLSSSEQSTLKSYFETLFSADTTYIKSNAQANPGTLAVTPSDLVAPSGGGPCSGSGAVTTGTGTVS